MKKKLFGILCCCFMLLLVGCGSKSAELKTTKCTLTKNDVVNGYKLESTYEISYSNDSVKKVHSIEKVISESSEILDQFETTLNNTYSTMNNTYGGYTYEVKKSDDNVTSDVTIDYEKVDLDKLSKDDSSISAIINDDKEISKEKLQSMYESLSATCEEVK